MTRGRILPTRSLFVITNTNVRTRAKRPNSRSPRRRPSILPPAPSGSLSARQTDRHRHRERERESVLCAENKDYYKHKQRARRGFLFVAGHETRNAKEPRVEIGRRRARRGRRILFCPKDTHARAERERESDLIRDSILISRGRKRERERGARAVRIGNGARYPQRLRHHEHKV